MEYETLTGEEIKSLLNGEKIDRGNKKEQTKERTKKSGIGNIVLENGENH